jgi:hypothetical protein
MAAIFGTEWRRDEVADLVRNSSVAQNAVRAEVTSVCGDWFGILKQSSN